MELCAAEMLMEMSTAGVTLRVSGLEVTPPWAALMTLEPTALPVARPLASMLTAAGLDDVQTTEWV